MGWDKWTRRVDVDFANVEDLTFGDCERWMPVPGHKGYEASSCGRVRSLPRVVERRHGFSFPVRGQILKPTVVASGYLYVTMGGPDNRRRNVGLAHVVWAAFDGGWPPKDKLVAFRNGMRWDCRIGNLCLVAGHSEAILRSAAMRGQFIRPENTDTSRKWHRRNGGASVG